MATSSLRVLPAQPRPDQALRTHLTARERVVLWLLAAGLTNPEIGRVLDLSSETIKSHVKHMLRAMDCRNRAELVNVGWQRGYLPADAEWVHSQLSRLTSGKGRKR